MDKQIMDKQIIDQLYNLYITQTRHYLLQHSNGNYTQADSRKINENTGKPYHKLQQWRMKEHLQGKKTIGTFAGESQYIKFITFDVDYSNLHMAKWITYKVSETLSGYGIEHHISFSGSKGYHIDIFFEDLIALKSAVKFYNLILNESGVNEFSDHGDVEFRPTDKQGVKLPMGFHQKTKAYCGFCKVEDGLKVMSKKESEQYFLSITKIKRQQVLDIIGEYEDDEIAITDKKKIIDTDESLSRYDGSQYDKSTDDLLNEAIDLLQNGLKMQGTRNKSIIKIAGYLKYTGLDQDEVEEVLNDWIDRQDKTNYTTKLADCYKENKEVAKWVFEKDFQIRPIIHTVEVSLNEINTIIEKCPDKNQKLIMYAMLIHSKRLANMEGVFFMSFNQMVRATGVVEKTTRNQVEKLIDLGLVEVIERNRKQKGTHKKKPNIYRVNLNVDVSEEKFTTESDNNFRECVLNFYTEKELQLMFPRRQFKSLIG